MSAKATASTPPDNEPAGGSYPPWDKVRGTSDRWGPGVTTIYKLIGEGRVRARKIGSSTVVSQDDMRTVIESGPKVGPR